MKIIHILSWIIRIVLFVLIVVLILNNMGRVQFNFYGIYSWTTPLIVVCLIFFLLGIIIGVLFSSLRVVKLKFTIRALKKQLSPKVE